MQEDSSSNPTSRPDRKSVPFDSGIPVRLLTTKACPPGQEDASRLHRLLPKDKSVPLFYQAREDSRIGSFSMTESGKDISIFGQFDLVFCCNLLF
jgi:hypothetical protein